ncbi:hypothetical protein POTOM_043946 [Populus tomentosa]|uniref:Uncharacterized protein n=1 Tax=Populus tomentosa TaxID=118781 RepID=A0A8X7YMG5_POPTO|nr:hypothetical protein POTOM_043946 [Populus tomentosa]
MNDPNDHKYRKYHPYQDLYNVPAQNLYNLPTSPEFLFHEESLNQRRSWSENLQYYTGTGYLTGAILGGSKGSIEGIRAAEPGESLKLRVNRVLNSGGHAGRKFGNNLGVLGLMFAGIESGLIHWRDTDDLVNTVLAGLSTGFWPMFILVSSMVGICWCFQWELDENLGISGKKRTFFGKEDGVGSRIPMLHSVSREM